MGEMGICQLFAAGGEDDCRRPGGGGRDAAAMVKEPRKSPFMIQD